MVRVSVGNIVPKVHVSVAPPATVGFGVHLSASGPLSVQVSPAGTVSVSVTLGEPVSPPAVTVMSYDTTSPTATLGVFVVLVTETSGGSASLVQRHDGSVT